MAKASADPIFIDTNILIRATIMTAPLHDDAQTILVRFREERRELWISNQVIREYVANTSRAQSYSSQIPMPQILDEVKRFRAIFRVAEDTAAVLDQLVKLLDKVHVGGKQIHDANIVAAMLVNKISTLCTYNVADFARFSSYITVLGSLHATSE